jgi:branched-chain amino acid transport system ATP-binding protein
MSAQLEIAEVSKSFGGVLAVGRVSLEVRRGEILSVIGPNGAGKTTLLNMISGFYHPDSGRIALEGSDVTHTAPSRMAELGVARTFQNIALFPAATVEENLMLGRHHLTRAGFVGAGLRLPFAVREDRRHRARVSEIAEFLGIGGLLGLPAGELSYGDQKRVEMARALSVEPAILLLDEPVAGMDADETGQVATAIRDIREGLDISILLVEHDMGLVMGIADRVTVLDFGRRIADGTPTEVRADREVIRAYLGSGSDGAEPAPAVAEADAPAPAPAPAPTPQTITPPPPAPPSPEGAHPPGAWQENEEPQS